MTQKEPLQQWIGRSERMADVVTPTPYAALAATLDRDPARPAPGTPLPALWHWLYFLPLHRHSAIGPDGHAQARRISAAGAVAAPDVGRQPADVSSVAARR